jgi:hypothetical protein
MPLIGEAVAIGRAALSIPRRYRHGCGLGAPVAQRNVKAFSKSKVSSLHSLRNLLRALRVCCSTLHAGSLDLCGTFVSHDVPIRHPPTERVEHCALKQTRLSTIVDAYDFKYTAGRR